MHHEIHYKPGPAEDLRAMQDLRDWIGEERWAILGNYALGPHPLHNLFRSVRMLCVLSGVSGRPVNAYLRAILSLRRTPYAK